MGQRVAHHLVSANILDYIELSSEHSIVEIKATSSMIGKDLITLDIRAKYGCNVIAIKSGKGMNISPDPYEPIKDGDVLVVVGSNTDLKTFEVMNDEA
jgi:trk system potassium uptake protein TrkA